MMNIRFGVLSAIALASSAVCAGEEIVHIEEMDRLAQRTALFNEGASVEEARYGGLMMHFTGKKGTSLHKKFFPLAKAAKQDKWALYFRFRFDANEGSHAIGLQLFFGDAAKPESQIVTLAEAGSFIPGGAKPAAPKEGMAGFVFGWGEAGLGAWNSGALTFDGGKATLWTTRGGKLAADCTGTLPKKPLVGWNLVALEDKTDCRLDRVIVADGATKPYEHGDLQECIAEIAQEKPANLESGFGAEMKIGEELPLDLTKNRFVAQFKAPFRSRTKKDPEIGCAFEIMHGKKAERINFGAKALTGEAKFRVFKGGKFVNSSAKTTVEDCVLTISGNRLGLHTLPPIRHWGGYETEEIAELIAARDKFLKPADRVYTLEVVQNAQGECRVTLNGQLLRTVSTKEPVTGIKFVGGTGAQARYRTVAQVAKPGPETWNLQVAKGGFKLERVRENLGTFALECNHYLSRDAYESMPSSCLWNVPRKQWARAKARCKIDPNAPAGYVPVIVARLTHFFDNGGRSIAMCEESVDLSKADKRVVRKGNEYEVTFDFDIGSIMDLTSMTDGVARAVLPFLHFEFTGPVWDKSRYYIDAGRCPAEELRSNVIVLSGSLEESPVWFRVTPERPYSLYYPGQTPQMNLSARSVDGRAYAVEVETVQQDASDKPCDRQRLEVGKALETKVNLPTSEGLGLYKVAWRVVDEKGVVVQRFESSYGLLPENTREAGYESPYYSWNFNGSHGTPPKFDDWAPAYVALGVNRTLVHPNMPETSKQMKTYGFTLAEFPYIGVGADEKSKKQAMARMREYVKAFPHCKQALVFHESGGGPYPKEIYGEKTVLNDWAKNHQSNRVAQATRCIQAWHEVDPSVRMIVGNCGDSYGLISELMRGGLDKKLVDSWGEESVGLTMPPEMTTAFTPWCIRHLAKIYGYTQEMDCPWEWKCRTERYERSSRGAAAVNLRDALIAHSLNYRTVPVGCGTETANSYADTIWCSGTFTRWPMAYPRENALAIATMTLVLDCAKYVRQVPTGSLTAYALEFKGKKGEWIYALWTARGETGVKMQWKGGTKVLGIFDWKPDYTLVTMLGRRSETDGERVAIGDEPTYLIAEKQVDSFVTEQKRTFRYENPEALAKNREAAAFDRAADVTLDASEDVRIDTKFEPNPFRPGKFALRDAKDEEKGDCIELEHLSQEACPEIMNEYVKIVLRKPVEVKGPFDTIGVWAKGNSNWGKVYFELEDAEGERWLSSGQGGVGCYVYDWPCKLSFNYDGWNFLQAPLTGKSDVRIVGPGANEWQWTRDASGNGRIDWPVKVRAIGVSQFGRTLDLHEMRKSPTVLRFKGISVR